MTTEKYLTPKEAAGEIGVSTRVLERLRKQQHKGPPWKKIGGRILYLRDKLLEWDRALTNE